MLVPVDNNPFSAVEYDAESAEAAIVFAVCALAEIGNAKNNLIGVSEVCKRYLFVRAFSYEKKFGVLWAKGALQSLIFFSETHHWHGQNTQIIITNY